MSAWSTCGHCGRTVVGVSVDAVLDAAQQHAERQHTGVERIRAVHMGVSYLRELAPAAAAASVIDPLDEEV